MYKRQILVVVISLLCSVYVGWVWKTRSAIREIAEGAPGFDNGKAVSLAKIWAFFIRFVCPLVIGYVLYQKLFGG